jgi:hypothetical protein
MLAPTRDLVAELNQRARQPPPPPHPQPLRPPAAVALADGNLAPSATLVITRSNDRPCAHSDRLGEERRPVARHRGRRRRIGHRAARPNGRTSTCPPAYVATSVELGYACTIHTAQGVTADTSTPCSPAPSHANCLHGAHPRRLGNHLYLEVVGDGDEHNVVRPDHTHPRTATDLLERDPGPRRLLPSPPPPCADQADPAYQLADEVNRYVDSLYVAAEHRLGPAQVARLDAAADRIVPTSPTPMPGPPCEPTCCCCRRTA